MGWERLPGVVLRMHFFPPLLITSNFDRRDFRRKKKEHIISYHILSKPIQIKIRYMIIIIESCMFPAMKGNRPRFFFPLHFDTAPSDAPSIPPANVDNNMSAKTFFFFFFFFIHRGMYIMYITMYVCTYEVLPFSYGGCYFLTKPASASAGLDCISRGAQRREYFAQKV
ncbi:hypothetical protein AA313_de0203427 [Arthrobotrys entomopaga]|nr:hypothetical protein AA313_de0203427 [Arthrobotrys entomopaga]